MDTTTIGRKLEDRQELVVSLEVLKQDILRQRPRQPIKPLLSEEIKPQAMDTTIQHNLTMTSQLQLPQQEVQADIQVDHKVK